MNDQAHITQRDLRNRSREIMDALAAGASFTVTRSGHDVGELIPLRRRRRFVPREEFAAMSKSAPAVVPETSRDDHESWVDGELKDPYA